MRAYRIREGRKNVYVYDDRGWLLWVGPSVVNAEQAISRLLAEDKEFDRDVYCDRGL